MRAVASLGSDFSQHGSVTGPIRVGGHVCPQSFYCQGARRKRRAAAATKQRSLSLTEAHSSMFSASGDTPEWKKGSLIYIGWPDEPERELRVCLRVVPRKNTKIPAGIFCRAGRSDPNCYGANQPLIG